MSLDARHEALVLALLAGAWGRRPLVTRIRDALEAPAPEVEALVRELRRRFPELPPERALREALADRSAPLGAAARALVAHRATPSVLRFHLPPLAGADPAAFAPALPRIDTAAEAAALVGLDPRDVAFFTGPHLRSGRPALAASHAHYRYRWIPKQSGGLRLLEVPKPRLRAMQRALLDQVLARVPLHPAAHAFTRDRSVRTFAAPHAGTRVVVRCDLEDFFAAVGGGRVRALFVALGYPDAVAELFTALACHRTSSRVLAQRPSPSDELLAVARAARESRRFARAHLPQGAPSSPRLASLAAFGLDVRLDSLARRLDATYTRYADDLAFSGDAYLEGGVRPLIAAITAIANDEGFAVRFDKTRVMRSSARQALGGLVVNQWPDVSRARYDALRARLHRVARGIDLPETSEARARLQHELAGHVTWASARPHRARKLAALLEAASARLTA